MPPKLVVPVRSLFPTINSSPEHSSKRIDLIRATFLQDSKSDARSPALSADIVIIEILRVSLQLHYISSEILIYNSVGKSFSTALQKHVWNLTVMQIPPRLFLNFLLLNYTVNDCAHPGTH